MLLAIAALLPACTSAGETARATIEPRDLLTDPYDDGSLVAGLFSRDPEVRWVAACGLARLPDTGGSRAVLQRLPTETDEYVLAELCFTLGLWQTREGIDALLRLTTHPSPFVREAAYEALGRMGDDRLAALVSDGLADPSPLVRGAAALALFRLDGRRYDHERRADESTLERRDAALTAAMTRDREGSVRWRATYAAASVRGRPALRAALERAVNDSHALVRLFAVRGLRNHVEEDGVGARLDVLPMLADADPRVQVEAARWAAEFMPFETLLDATRAHSSPHVRAVAVAGVARRLERRPSDAVDAALVRLAYGDDSAVVRREAAAALVIAGADDADEWFTELATSTDVRDRERAAALLGSGAATDDRALRDLVGDEAATVRAAALEALASRPELPLDPWLERGLADDDPAVLVSAARVAGERIRDGTAPPWIARAVAERLEELEGPDLLEARQALRDALGVPREDPPAEIDRPDGRLLNRLLAEFGAASSDPHPRVRMITSRGPIEIELDRVGAPRHVASFLELAGLGFYDGLDVHRVVPNFVIQGLDPRGDGWGTGGRRLPDEINRVPYLTGTLGMPNAGEPNSGGCQIFITHLPTPHLDGHYTVFGRVTSGLDVVQAIEVGDAIVTVRRIDELRAPAPLDPTRKPWEREPR